MTSLALVSDESICLSCENITHYKDKGNVFGATTESGDLVLTNQRLVFIPKKVNPFAKEKDGIEIPLSQIAIHGDMVQIEVLRPGGRSDGYHVSVYGETAKEEFAFSYYDDKKSMALVERLNELIFGDLSHYDPQKAGFAASVNKKIAGVVNAAKPIAADLFDIAKPLVETASTAAAVHVSSKGNLLNQVIGAAEVVAAKTKNALGDVKGEVASDSKDTDVLSAAQDESLQGQDIDHQIEMVKKLKSLLDAGILTQDEFEAKKKQILGI